MKFDPFDKLSCKYGAHFGRSDARGWIGGTICARHQGGGDGYDKGGAYWGTPSTVWAVWVHGAGPITVHYVRAESKRSAIDAANTKIKQEITP
jgi:hypothetical protein